MKNFWKITIIFLLTAAVFAVVALKQHSSEPLPIATAENNSDGNSVALPRLVELGSDQCIPCKQMAPILDELTAELAGKLKVEFYDVWKNQEYGKKFNIRLIPTQIFIGSDGNELFRHEGFYSKADILAKWKQLGYDFSEAQ